MLNGRKHIQNHHSYPWDKHVYLLEHVYVRWTCLSPYFCLSQQICLFLNFCLSHFYEHWRKHWWLYCLFCALIYLLSLLYIQWIAWYVFLLSHPWYLQFSFKFRTNQSFSNDTSHHKYSLFVHIIFIVSIRIVLGVLIMTLTKYSIIYLSYNWDLLHICDRFNSQCVPFITSNTHIELRVSNEGNIFMQLMRIDVVKHVIALNHVKLNYHSNYLCFAGYLWHFCDPNVQIKQKALHSMLLMMCAIVRNAEAFYDDFVAFICWNSFFQLWLTIANNLFKMMVHHA